MRSGFAGASPAVTTCGGGIDQRAARFAVHLFEGIEQMTQLAELQGADLEAPIAQRDSLVHRVYSLTLSVPIVPVASAKALKSNSWIS